MIGVTGFCVHRFVHQNESQRFLTHRHVVCVNMCSNSFCHADVEAEPQPFMHVSL